MFFEVLVEGASDIAVIRELLVRHLGLVEGEGFRIHPHRGKGALPADPAARPDSRHRGLLDQLPAKLRGYAHLPAGYAVVVLVDADDDDCLELKQALVALCEPPNPCPPHVLFRIAVEETESWFLAQPEAVRAAYPRADVRPLQHIPPDAVVGAWERLARALGRAPETCTGADKHVWAKHIAPYLNFDEPVSPSLGALVSGLEALT
jgi:hypothetical protein